MTEKRFKKDRSTFWDNDKRLKEIREAYWALQYENRDFCDTVDPIIDKYVK